MMTSLSEQLLSLGLRGVGEGVDDLIQRATQKRWSPMQLIEAMVTLEVEDRAHRSLERRTKRSKIGRFTPMADFDWNWPKRLDRERVEACLRLEFIDSAANVVLVAPHGLGKTMIAKNIAHQAILSGHSVLVTTASQLLLDLGSRDSPRALENRLRLYASIGLLVIDELGYLSYDSRNADLLFQLVSRRYEKKSIVLTTNLAFRDWPSIFPNATSATALIDRVVHHSEIIAIEGDSYRRRQAEEDKKERAATRRRSSAGTKKRGS